MARMVKKEVLGLIQAGSFEEAFLCFAYTSQGGMSAWLDNVLFQQKLLEDEALQRFIDVVANYVNHPLTKVADRAMRLVSGAICRDLVVPRDVVGQVIQRAEKELSVENPDKRREALLYLAIDVATRWGGDDLLDWAAKMVVLCVQQGFLVHSRNSIWRKVDQGVPRKRKRFIVSQLAEVDNFWREKWEGYRRHLVEKYGDDVWHLP